MPRRAKGETFTTADEMDALLIEAWNETVGPDDVVWHLGDFALGSVERGASIFARLNGSKRLCRGNHDRAGILELGWALPVRDLVEITDGGTRVVMCHYPMRAWPGAFRGSLHLYGHVHDLLPPTRQSCDVGVDSWGYRPVTLAEIKARLAGAEELPEEVRLARARAAALSE